METRKIKNGHRTTYFLIGSFTVLLLVNLHDTRIERENQRGRRGMGI